VKNPGFAMQVHENIHSAKTHLSRLVQRALQGDEVIVCKAGKPLVRLVPVAQGVRPPPGAARGIVESMADDFDAPLEDFSEHMR